MVILSGYSTADCQRGVIVIVHVRSDSSPFHALWLYSMYRYLFWFSVPSATLFFFGGCSSLLIGFSHAAASVVNQCFSQSMPQHLPRLDSSLLVNRKLYLFFGNPKMRSRHFGRVKGTDPASISRKLDKLGRPRDGWMATTIKFGCEQLLLQLPRTPYISYYGY